MIPVSFTILIKAVGLILSFVIGLLAGAVVWSRFRKPWPPEYDRLATQIKFLEDELGRVNSAVKVIRARAGYIDDTNRSLIVTGGDERDVLTQRLSSAKTILTCYRRDLESVGSLLGPLPGTGQPKRSPVVEPPREASPPVSPSDEEKREKYAPIEVDIRIEPKEEQFAGTSTAEEIVRLYNRALTDSSASARFRELYQPLRIGTINAVERRQNPTLEEEFRETTDGDFFAIPLSGRPVHAVVPRLGLTIEVVSLNAGALGKVFGILDFDSKEYYSRYTVTRPAIFRKEGQRWVLAEPGEMDLGPGHGE
jgi:hypothetical protein